MEILLWVVAWLVSGCVVAWMIGAAASMSDVPAGHQSSPPDAIGNIDHFPLAERAQAEVGAESTVARTDQGRCRSL
jgi:hypothetical protein